MVRIKIGLFQQESFTSLSRHLMVILQFNKNFIMGGKIIVYDITHTMVIR